LLSPAGEDGRGQATTQLLGLAWICVPPRLFLWTGIAIARNKKYNKILLFFHGLMGRD
jgi:hypothetical protein